MESMRFLTSDRMFNASHETAIKMENIGLYALESLASSSKVVEAWIFVDNDDSRVNGTYYARFESRNAIESNVIKNGKRPKTWNSGWLRELSIVAR